MPNGDLGTQSTEEIESLVAANESEVAADSGSTEPRSESAAEGSTHVAALTPPPPLTQSRSSRLRSRIAPVWQRLQEQRREAAAVIVLIVMAMVWFDTGSSDSGKAPDAADPLDAFEATLSDFEPVQDTNPVRESADPFESSSPDPFHNGSSLPPSEIPVSENTAFSEFDTSTITARYPDEPSSFNTSSTQTTAEYGSDQQQRRKVKFAGRIKPAN